MKQTENYQNLGVIVGILITDPQLENVFPEEKVVGGVVFERMAALPTIGHKLRLKVGNQDTVWRISSIFWELNDKDFYTPVLALENWDKI